MMTTRLEVADRAGLREAHLAFAKGVAREMGIEGMAAADFAMDVEVRENFTLLLWLQIGEHRLEVTAPLIAFVDDEECGGRQ